MKTTLKILGAIVLVVILLLAGIGLFLYYVIYYAPMVPKDYVVKTETGGEIEARYLAMGEFEVAYWEEKAECKAIKKYEVWYPKELLTEHNTYPVVVVVNGTGVFASKAKPLFEHLASWGLIVIGNEDGSTWSGNTADQTLDYLLQANENPDSIFYGKVDTSSIGITGHSQGGVGVWNAITVHEHSSLYRCAVSLSPTEEEMAALLQMPYDPSKATIPVMILAGTEHEVISLEKMQDTYSKITAPKIMARKSGTDHGQMLYRGDGYVTAWFLYWLKNDTEAGEAFVGDSAELLTNPNWQDVMNHTD